MPGRARARTRDLVIVGVLLLGLLAGLALVITGGGSEPPEESAAPRATLPEDTSIAALEEWAGLAFPEGTDDLLTARPSAEQLDVTFTMPADAEQAFVEGSGLPELVSGDRQVLHSSPLWRLNPGGEAAEGDAAQGGEASTSTTAPQGNGSSTSSASAPQPEIRGAGDVRDGVRRAVEVVEESAGTLRVRAVLVASG
jgi:hypothetical protein